jgi:hypothetical protein
MVLGLSGIISGLFLVSLSVERWPLSWWFRCHMLLQELWPWNNWKTYVRGVSFILCCALGKQQRDAD